jgi:hypothetical protein
MSRSQLRGLSIVFLVGLGAWFIYLGFEGWVLKGLLPAQYLGFLILASGIGGMFGVNVWANGPLDPRNDRPVPTPDPTVAPPRQ